MPTTTKSNGGAAKRAASASRRSAVAAKPARNGTKGKPAAKAAAAKATGNVAAKQASSRDAAAQLLRDATGPMRVADIADAIVAGNLAGNLKGKTPKATIGAQLYTACKGTGSRFVKVDRGLVDLRELNPRGAKKRPTAKA